LLLLDLKHSIEEVSLVIEQVLELSQEG